MYSHTIYTKSLTSLYDIYISSISKCPSNLSYLKNTPIMKTIIPSISNFHLQFLEKVLNGKISVNNNLPHQL